MFSSTISLCPPVLRKSNYCREKINTYRLYSVKFLQYIHLEHSSGFPQSIEGDPSSLLLIHPPSTWLYRLCTILSHPSDKPSNSLKSLVAMRIIYRLITIAMFYLSLHSYPPFSSPQKYPSKAPKMWRAPGYCAPCITPQRGKSTSAASWWLLAKPHRSINYRKLTCEISRSLYFGIQMT